MSIQVKTTSGNIKPLRFSCAVYSDLIENYMEEDEFLELGSLEKPIELILSDQEIEIFEDFCKAIIKAKKAVKAEGGTLGPKEITLELVQEYLVPLKPDDHQILNFYKICDYLICFQMKKALDLYVGRLFEMTRSEIDQIYKEVIPDDEKSRDRLYEEAKKEAIAEFGDIMLEKLYSIDPLFKSEVINLNKKYLC